MITIKKTDIGVVGQEIHLSNNELVVLKTHAETAVSALAISKRFGEIRLNSTDVEQIKSVLLWVLSLCKEAEGYNDAYESLGLKAITDEIRKEEAKKLKLPVPEI